MLLLSPPVRVNCPQPSQDVEVKVEGRSIPQGRGVCGGSGMFGELMCDRVRVKWHHRRARTTVSSRQEHPEVPTG